MLSFLRRQKQSAELMPITTDIHSHLLADIDDGVHSHEEALEIIREFQRLGYHKLITTPHIIQDYYRNTPEGIKQRLADLKKFLTGQGVHFEIEAAAEYYLDEELPLKVERREELLTFGDRLLLFETNMLTEPYHLKEFIFRITSEGYKPVLAHPERYAYMNLEKAEDLRDRGILFQLNILSLIGYYGPPVQQMAQRLVDRGWVELLGSDCHNIEHVRLIEAARKKRYFQKALALPLLNNSL